MNLTPYLLSACLALTTIAGTSTMTMSAALAHDSDRGHHAHGHHAQRHHRQEHRQHRRYHRQGHRQAHRQAHRRGHHSYHHYRHGNAFAAGTALGLVLGWSGGYGYPYAHRDRYVRHHRPYYVPRRHNHHAYYGHTQRHYTYTDGYYNANQGYRAYGNRGCHPVYKFGHWQGSPAKVGGTMCYDNRGNAYIVQGSRYLIHYQ